MSIPDFLDTDSVELPQTRHMLRRTSPTYAVACELAIVTGMDFDLNQGRLLREAKTLLVKGKAEAVCATLREQYGDPAGWWHTMDWRGRRGQRPTPQAIRETWGSWNATPTPRTTYAIEIG